MDTSCVPLSRIGTERFELPHAVFGSCSTTELRTIDPARGRIRAFVYRSPARSKEIWVLASCSRLMPRYYDSTLDIVKSAIFMFPPVLPPPLSRNLSTLFSSAFQSSMPLLPSTCMAYFASGYSKSVPE